MCIGGREEICMQRTVRDKRKITPNFSVPSAITTLIAMLFLLTGPLNAQPSWESGVGGPNLETAYKVERTQTPGFEDGVLAIGGTDSYGFRFDNNPPNLYVTYTDPSGTGVIGWAFDLQSWDEDYSIVEIPSDNKFAFTTGVWNENTGSYDIAVICIDYTGTVLWSRFFGSFGRDGGTSITLLESGTYAGDLVVAGIYENSNGDNDGVLIRIDNNGIVQAGLRYDCSSPGLNANDRFYCVRQDNIEGYGSSDYVYVVGATNGANILDFNDDIWLLNISLTNFAIINTSTVYDGANNSTDRGYSLTQTHNPNIPESFVTLVGESYQTQLFPLTQSDATVIRTRFNGSLGAAGTFHRVYNIPNATDPSWDVAYAVEPNLANDGGVVVVGQTNNFSEPNGNAFAMEIDNASAVVIANVYGSDEYETARSLDVTPGVGYYFGGTTYSNGPGGGDQWIAYATPTLQTGLDINTSQSCADPVNPGNDDFGTVSAISPSTYSISAPVAPSFSIDMQSDVEQFCQGPPNPAPPLPTDVEMDEDLVRSTTAESARTNSFFLAPNPVGSGEDISLRLIKRIPGDAVITVADALGRTLMEIDGSVVGGVRNHTISTQGWSSGAYTISIRTGADVQSETIIVHD